MPSVLRSLAAFAFVSAIAVLSAPGCSEQSEGQRCDNAANGDADCDAGLVCVKARELRSALADICCNADPANDSDSRCERSGGVIGGGGSSGSASTDAGAGGLSPASAGAAGDAAGGTLSAAGAPGAAGTPTTTDGGVGAGGAPVVTTDGGASGASTAGQGGAG